MGNTEFIDGIGVVICIGITVLLIAAVVVWANHCLK